MFSRTKDCVSLDDDDRSEIGIEYDQRGFSAFVHSLMSRVRNESSNSARGNVKAVAKQHGLWHSQRGRF